MFFWEDVAAGLSSNIYSETLLRRADGQTIHVIVPRQFSPALIMPVRCTWLPPRDHTDQRQVE